MKRGRIGALVVGAALALGTVQAGATAEFQLQSTQGNTLRFEWSDPRGPSPGSSRPKGELSQVRYEIGCQTEQ